MEPFSHEMKAPKPDEPAKRAEHGNEPAVQELLHFYLGGVEGKAAPLPFAADVDAIKEDPPVIGEVIGEEPCASWESTSASSGKSFVVIPPRMSTSAPSGEPTSQCCGWARNNPRRCAAISALAVLLVVAASVAIPLALRDGEHDHDHHHRGPRHEGQSGQTYDLAASPAVNQEVVVALSNFTDEEPVQFFPRSKSIIVNATNPSSAFVAVVFSPRLFPHPPAGLDVNGTDPRGPHRRGDNATAINRTRISLAQLIDLTCSDLFEVVIDGPHPFDHPPRNDTMPGNPSQNGDQRPNQNGDQRPNQNGDQEPDGRLGLEGPQHQDGSASGSQLGQPRPPRPPMVVFRFRRPSNTTAPIASGTRSCTFLVNLQTLFFNRTEQTPLFVQSTFEVTLN